MSNSTDISLYEVLETWFRSKSDSIHTCIPGEIIEYYGHSKRKAKVQPLVKPMNFNKKIINIQPIDNVPIIFPGTKETNIIYPLKRGDGLLLFFAESPIGNFLNNIGTQPADDLNKFDLGDCIGIPGLWSFNNTPTPPSNNNDFFIKFQDTSITIKDKTNEIKIEDKLGNKIETNGTNLDLNGNSKKFVTYTELNTAITTFLIALMAHVHTSAAPGSPTSTPSSPISFDISAAESQRVRTS